jgi:exopolysaccharide production protein ExoZ
MAPGKRYGGIQSLRALSILLIVLNHLSVIEVKFGAGPVVLPSALSRGTGGLDLFFTISGLMMVLLNRGRFQSPRQALFFLCRRLARIYPLYWIFSLLVLPIYFLRPSWINSAQGNRVDLLSSFLLLPSDLLPLINVAWMLVHLVYFYLVFSFFLWLLREEQLPLALISWVGLVGAGQVYFYFRPRLGPAADLLVHPYTLEFITGCFLGLFLQRPQRLWGQAALTAGLILYGSVLLLLNSRPPAGLVTGWTRVVFFGPPAALILYGVMVLENQRQWSFPASLSLLGDASYAIYLSHMPVLAAAGRIWAMVSRPGLIHQGLALLCLTGLVILVGLLGHRFLDAPLMKILRAPSPGRLFGEPRPHQGFG